MPQPSALISSKKVFSPVNGSNIGATDDIFVEPAGRGNEHTRTICGWIFQVLICLLLGALGAWIYQVAFVSHSDCYIIQQLEDIPMMGMEPLKSTPNVQIQRKFTEQEQQKAMYSEMSVTPVHCKITKPDGFGNGTTISMAGYAKKDATQIDIFFKNRAGIYTFYMQLRWKPFEDSVFFTTQSAPGRWKNSNDEYPSSNPLRNEKGGLFSVKLQTRPTDMLVTITDSKGVATPFVYKHKEGFNQAESKEAMLTGNVERVTECIVL